MDGVPVYRYNLYGRVLTSIAGTRPLPSGDVVLGVRFDYDGGGLGKGGQVHLSVNGVEVATGRLERTVPFLFSMSGETLDVGVDTGAPAGPYPHRFPFTGRHRAHRDHHAARARRGLRRAGARRRAARRDGIAIAPPCPLAAVP